MGSTSYFLKKCFSETHHCPSYNSCFRAMLVLSPSAAQEKTLEAPVHHSSPQNASPAQNVSRTSGRHISPNQSSGSGIFCRICHEGDFMETLLYPCSCSGSVGFYSVPSYSSHFLFQVGVVHRSCLEKWLSSSQYDTCELCRL